MRDRDRQPRTLHSRQENRRGLEHLDRANTGLELLRRVANETPSENVTVRRKNVSNTSRAVSLKRMLFAHPSPAPSTSPYEKPPQATRPRNDVRSSRPDRISLMCTSTAAKPARSNAAAISICPLTPCSRRIATRGRTAVAITGRGTGLSDGSNVSAGETPGSSLSAIRSNSDSAQVGLSRSD